MRPHPGWLDRLPFDRLLAELSLWSADLGRLRLRRAGAVVMRVLAVGAEDVEPSQGGICMQTGPGTAGVLARSRLLARPRRPIHEPSAVYGSRGSQDGFTIGDRVAWVRAQGAEPG
jgi:hypothetical protein